MVDSERSAGTDFSAFFRREYPTLVRALVATTGNVPDAEEAVQEAMARAFERWGRVAGQASPAGWVYVTAVNAHRRIRRRLARFLLGRGEEVVAGGGVEDLIRRDLLFSGLRTLPAAERDALLMVAWLGLDSAEAAEVLGLEPASVRSRVHRARKHLEKTREEVTQND